jgi:hypothetical protein
MKNSILSILFVAVACFSLDINANQCPAKPCHKKRMNHTNRKTKTCGTKKSCGNKVRQNRYAKSKCGV